MKHPFDILAIVFFVTSCANIGNISGGEKDILPPEIKKEYPPNFHINSTTNQIILTFDEYLATTNLRGEITITPEPKTRPRYELKGKNIVIKFEEPLEENTTYVINFGKGIADLNENNVLDGYFYVFSTGDHIDSNYISGKVLDIVTQQPVPGCLVGLYSSGNERGDSALFFRPEYYSKTDSNGFFQIMYLPDDSFKIIAFTDKNNDFKIQQESELAGIYSNSKSSMDTTPVILYIAPQEAPAKPIFARIINPYTCLLTYQTPLHNFSVRSIGNSSIKHTHRTISRDTLVLFFSEEIRDSVILEVSTRFSKDTIRLTRRQVADEMLKLDRSSRADIPKYEAITFTSNYPIARFDKENILVISDDSVVVTEIDVKFTHPMEIELNFPKKTKTKYVIKFLPKSFFCNEFIWNDDTLSFTISVKEKEDFGEILLELKIDTLVENLYLVMEAKSGIFKKEFSITENFTKIKIPDLTPVSYFMYLYHDENNNKWWDKGDVFSRRNPEIKIEYSEDISLRANWDLELQWIVPLREALQRFKN